MRKSRNIFWGGLLMILGVLWLLRNMGYLDFFWTDFVKFWPLPLILAGLTLLLSGSDRSGVSGGIVAILIAVALIAGISHGSHRVLQLGSDWRPFSREDRNRSHRENSGSGENGSEDREIVKSRKYSYEMFSGLQEATFDFEGGAGDFSISGNTEKLFVATAKSGLIDYVSNLKINKSDQSAAIEFKMEDDNIKLDKVEVKNTVEMSLSELPDWILNFSLGVGKGVFDLSNNKVKALKMTTGLSDVEIKLGSRSKRTRVEIESGVASVHLNIPEKSGCRLKVDGVVNAKRLDGFIDLGNGLYETPAYEIAQNKIEVNYDASVSSVKITRY